MNYMTFNEAFIFFFTSLFDLTSLIVLISFIISLFLILFKKVKNLIVQLVTIFLSIVGGGANLLLQGVFFGLTGSGLIPSEYTGLLFSLSMCLIASIYMFLTYRKDRPNQLFAKITTVIASIFIINTMSKAFELFAGLSSQDDFYTVSICRSIPYFLLILTIFIIKKIDINHFKSLSTELLLALYGTNLALVVIAIYDSTLDEHGLEINILLTIISFTLYLLMILLYYSIYKINEYRHKAINHEVQTKLAFAKLNSLTLDKNNREEISKLRHDIKNQISYISLLLEQKKYDDAKKYLNDYLEKNSNVLNVFTSPNEVVNSIVNLELTKAKLSNININAKAIIPSKLPFKEIDLCSLITNILDNAIENCDRDKDSPILFSIFKQQDFIRIYCENTIKNDSHYGAEYKTSKKEKGHGYGIKIIKNIAKSYGGYAYFKVENNKFITDVLLELGEGMKNV